MDGVALIADGDADASTGGVGETGDARQLEAWGNEGMTQLDERMTQPDTEKSEIEIVGMEEAWAAGGGIGGDVDGELPLALNCLPQRMADLEELALGGFSDEVGQGEVRFILLSYSSYSLLLHYLP